jgi:hypothetical protein
VRADNGNPAHWDCALRDRRSPTSTEVKLAMMLVLLCWNRWAEEWSQLFRLLLDPLDMFILQVQDVGKTSSFSKTV